MACLFLSAWEDDWACGSAFIRAGLNGMNHDTAVHQGRVVSNDVLLGWHHLRASPSFLFSSHHFCIMDTTDPNRPLPWTDVKFLLIWQAGEVKPSYSLPGGAFQVKARRVFTISLWHSVHPICREKRDFFSTPVSQVQANGGYVQIRCHFPTWTHHCHSYCVKTMATWLSLVCESVKTVKQTIICLN